MNRDRMIDKFLHVKPNFYVVIDDQIVLLWARKTLIKEPYLISAILSPLGPFKFRTHHPTIHTGSYLFRRLNKRVYNHQIIKFNDCFWDDEKCVVSYSKFKEKLPYVKFNGII